MVVALHGPVSDGSQGLSYISPRETYEGIVPTETATTPTALRTVVPNADSNPHFGIASDAQRPTAPHLHTA